jgi:hypothetical protein
LNVGPLVNEPLIEPFKLYHVVPLLEYDGVNPASK